jgi:hypothetical protein
VTITGFPARLSSVVGSGFCGTFAATSGDVFLDLGFGHD